MMRLDGQPRLLAILNRIIAADPDGAGIEAEAIVEALGWPATLEALRTARRQTKGRLAQRLRAGLRQLAEETRRLNGPPAP